MRRGLALHARRLQTDRQALKSQAENRRYLEDRVRSKDFSPIQRIAGGQVTQHEQVAAEHFYSGISIGGIIG
jgi:hypothetical protein